MIAIPHPRHSREGGNPSGYQYMLWCCLRKHSTARPQHDRRVEMMRMLAWIPACASMTLYVVGALCKQTDMEDAMS